MDKQLIEEVQNLVKEVDKTHRYSMSRIYGLWNRIYEKNETPQSCASCLIRKVKELREWLNKQNIGVETELQKPTADRIVDVQASTQDTAKRRGRKKKQ